MPSGDTPPSRSRSRRWIRRFFLLCLALGVLLATLGFTGWPQRIGTGLLLSSQLGGTAQVGSIGLGNPLVAQGITLAAKAGSIYGPVVQVERVEATYRLAPENGRHIGNVALSGVDISLEQGETENNFQFLLDRFSQPGGGGDPTPWIPEQLDLERLRFNLQSPEFTLTADNLDIHALLESSTTGSVRLGAPTASLAWSSTAEPDSPRRTTGSIALDAAWNPDGADVDGVIDLGAFAQFNGAFSATTREGIPYYAVSLSEASLQDPIWSVLVNGLSPIPTRFDSAQFRDSDVHFHFPAGGIAIDQATVDGSFTGFAVGPEDAPFYSGPLQLALRGNYGDQTEIVGTMTLRDRLALEAAFQLTPDGLKGTFGWEPWPRDDLIALTPPAYAGILSTLAPLARLGAKGTIAQSPGAFTVDGALVADFGDDAPMNIPISLSWTTESGLSTMTLSAEAAMEGARLKSTTTVPQDGAVRVENTLTAFSPNAWAEHILGKSIAPGLVAALTGRANLSLFGGQPLEIDLELSSPGLGYGSMALPAEPPVALAGKMTYDTASGRLSGKSLRLAQEGTVDIAAAGWSVDLPKATLASGLEGTLSLDTLASMFALPGLSGAAAISGRLQAGPTGTRLENFHAISEDLLYGEWGVPYGSQLTLSGDLAYESSSRTLALAPILAAIGDGTRCALTSMVFAFPRESTPLKVDLGGLKLDSDLDLLVRRQLIASVTGGHATLSSEQLAWNGESFSGMTTWELRAESLELPEKMGAFKNLVHSGKYDPGKGEPGGGPLSVGPFSIYEIPFGATATEVTVTPEALSCATFETAFLGGTLALSGALKYREADYPGTVRAEARELDLEQFTQTFKPPDVVMTGKVNGTADLTVSAAGLVDLNVDLTASENLTLNQAAVRQILMQQIVNDAVDSKQIQKVIEKVIGKDEQRAFKKAVIKLQLEDGLVVGVARLESTNLDVTVDIKAEPEAILQAIQSAAEDTP